MTCKADFDSYLPSTSLSDSSGERNISLPTRPFTGSPGLVQQLLYLSSPMLSPVVSPSLVVLFPSSVRSSVHSSLFSPWAVCGYTTTGRTSVTPDGILWLDGACSSSFLVLSLWLLELMVPLSGSSTLQSERALGPALIIPTLHKSPILLGHSITQYWDTYQHHLDSKIQCCSYMLACLIVTKLLILSSKPPPTYELQSYLSKRIRKQIGQIFLGLFFLLPPL
jgi:hypothetical protein